MRSAALIWVVGLASTFTFLSVFWWALQRRREREALYRHETARRLIERGETESALSWLRENEAEAEGRRRGGLGLTALLSMATGIGILLGMHDLRGEVAIHGWVPLLAGAALLVHLFFTRRKAS
ncbi:MAG TPA: hypothetical protein VJ725_32025 [Thermoanaerobaculia bacterium]|nr:hypothetical protein [Thermoanaerobaculia bacterium]